MFHRLLATALIGLVLSGPALAQTAGSPSTLSLNGTGTVAVAPDIATLRIGVDTREHSAAGALAANSRAAGKVIAALRAAGVAERDIQTANFSVSAVYREPANRASGELEIAGYQVTNEVVARIRDLAGLGAILDRVVAEGANRINSLSFGLEDDGPALDQARVLAVEDARRKAELYVKAAGVTLGPVLSIADFGGGAVPVAEAAMFRAGAAVPIAQGELAATATVAMVWQIVPLAE